MDGKTAVCCTDCVNNVHLSWGVLHICHTRLLVVFGTRAERLLLKVEDRPDEFADVAVQKASFEKVEVELRARAFAEGFYIRRNSIVASGEVCMESSIIATKKTEEDWYVTFRNWIPDLDVC